MLRNTNSSRKKNLGEKKELCTRRQKGKRNTKGMTDLTAAKSREKFRNENTGN